MLMVLTVFMAFWSFTTIARAHCDTLEGPVIMDAKAALEKSDITPVLKWIKKEYEEVIKEAFKKTLTVRKQNKEAKELADMYFFETLVRIHRQGEGAPYIGLKSEKPEPIILEVDKALEIGSADNLIENITNTVANGIKEHFIKAIEAKKYANESVQAGGKFVKAYVEFTHYIESLYNDATMPYLKNLERSKPEKPHH